MYMCIYNIVTVLLAGLTVNTRYSTILSLLLYDLVTVSLLSVLVSVRPVLVQLRSQIWWAPMHFDVHVYKPIHYI